MLNNKIIFITWGTWSWGNELTEQILSKYEPKEVRIYSRWEHKQVEMKQKFWHNPKLKFIIGDVRDKNIMTHAMKGSDYVFHLAALKHVPVCEENPWEAVLTNVYGTQNVIECAIENNVEKVVDISTDKAVDPFNHYGCTKACGEKMIINANINYNSNTKFVCIRGGNVIGTNGSVIPLFKKQIIEKNNITITDGGMTRFLMSTREAIGLIFQALEYAIGWEVFVMRMPATTVEVIADTMIGLFGNEKTQKTTIGSRPWEKQSEVLVSKNESPYTRVLNEKYYVILPQFQNQRFMDVYGKFDAIELPFFDSNNTTILNQHELQGLLRNEKWLWG